VRAGTVTLRIGERLVGLRADTEQTLRRLRTLFASWIDDDHPDVPWAFDVRLDPADEDRRSDVLGRRTVRAVPQLRAGQLLMARSRVADDVLRALAHVLGGVLAEQDANRTWSGLRPFVHADRIVLVDARPPALSASAELVRNDVAEVACWNVALDLTPAHATVHVPPPLTALDWAALDLAPPSATWRTATLAGLLALDPQSDHSHDDHAGARPVSAGGAFSRFAVRHPTSGWFATVQRLIRDGRVILAADPADARRRLVELLTPASPRRDDAVTP
jgi:hypothetical protein